MAEIKWESCMLMLDKMVQCQGRVGRFHCVGGCWDRTQDSCDLCIDSQTLG